MKQKILIADDNRANREFLVSLLGSTGFATTEACDGVEALELARRERPDLIIADLVMPKMDGYDLAKEVRSDSALAQTPIIFFTANYVEAEGRELAEACGAQVMLSKPCDPEDILKRVRATLQQPILQSTPTIPFDFDREHRLVLTNKLSQKVEELERLNSTLECRVQEIAQSEKTAQSANRAKDRFIATLSHELRTPLTPVLALVSYLVKQTSALPPELRNEIEMIQRNVELEAHLIDDLLDITRISSGKLELALEVVDAHVAIRHALEICAQDIGAKKLIPELDLQASDCRVMADPVRLYQAFWNILSNSVKFTPSGGRVTIRSRNDPERNFIVEVDDTGIGFNAATLAQMFDAFEQGDRSITQEFGGLGLGLTIAKGLVEAHHGRLEAFSRGKNTGATFRIILATVTTEVNPVRRSFETQSPKTPLRILLVEDHEDTRRILGNLLRVKGHEVRSAATVSSALEVLSREPVDVLLSDIGLPDGTGYELMERAKAIQPLAGIAISGFGMAEDIARGVDSGFAHHLIKPVNFDQLETALRGITPRRVFQGDSPRARETSFGASA